MVAEFVGLFGLLVQHQSDDKNDQRDWAENDTQNKESLQGALVFRNLNNLGGVLVLVLNFALIKREGGGLLFAQVFGIERLWVDSVLDEHFKGESCVGLDNEVSVRVLELRVKIPVQQFYSRVLQHWLRTFW